MTSANTEKLAYFKETFEGAIYKVNSVTNFNGTKVPTEFTLTSFWPLATNKPYMVFVGRIARVGPNSMATPLPEIRKPLAVADYRFRENGSKVDYISVVSLK
jgi:hypothetical protein